LVFGDFALQWQPVPPATPYRTQLAYAVAVLLVLAGTSLWRRRTAMAGAAALAILFALCVLLLHGPQLIARPLVFVSWSGAAEQAALAAAGLIAFAANGGGGAHASRLARAGRIPFAICLTLFGARHFVYLHFTASMVPGYLPPSRPFWAIATGAAHIAAGLAILSGIRARLAAILLAAMFAVFGLLVHLPSLVAEPESHLNWAANAMNLALAGAAWVVADSIGPRRR
jgi:uncharacterized membrane protein YphA (DoxX/SURF4 family)